MSTNVHIYFFVMNHFNNINTCFVLLIAAAQDNIKIHSLKRSTFVRWFAKNGSQTNGLLIKVLRLWHLYLGFDHRRHFQFNTLSVNFLYILFFNIKSNNHFGKFVMLPYLQKVVTIFLYLMCQKSPKTVS